MVFTFPLSVQRSNSSESTKSGNHQYHYKRTSTLPQSFSQPQIQSLSQKPNNTPGYRSSTSSFGSETPRAPARPRSPPPPPKSPKRFWAFSAHTTPPLPPIPDMSAHSGHVRSSSTNSIGLGTGATVIRRPSEAARTMKQNSRSKGDKVASRQFGHSPIETLTREYEAMTTILEPGTAPLPSSSVGGYKEVPRILPATAPLRTKNSRTSLRPSSTRIKTHEEVDKRATIKPPPRTVLPPTPFAYHLISHTSRPAPTAESSTIIQLDFAYSTDERSKNDSVTLPLEVLKRGGGHLVEVVERVLGGRSKTEQRGSVESDKSNPDLTDGESTGSEESELDSEYGLEALLRDEYLQSLMLPDSPDILKSFPPPPPLPESFSITIPSTNKPRAQTRNQYAQQDKFPSPSSPYTARSHTLPLVMPRKQNAHALTISTAPVPEPCPKDGGGVITELKILLLRDAMPYHLIAQRLIAGNFASTGLLIGVDEARKRRVAEEASWLGMLRLADELSDGPRAAPVPVPSLKHKKSGVITGGQGYI